LSLGEHTQISHSARIGENVAIWAGTHIREGAEIGDGTSLGQFCYVGPGVVIGKNCSIQNHALIYEPAVLHDAVFIGPRVVIANDIHPRAVNLDGSRKKPSDWSPQAAEIGYGASLGAGSICVGAIKIGEWAMVAAGSVVVRDVGKFELVAGVPSKQIGWVGRAGFKLVQISELTLECPKTSETYQLSEDGTLDLKS